MKRIIIDYFDPTCPLYKHVFKHVDNIDNNSIHCLIGARRIGKNYLISKICTDVTISGKKTLLYINISCSETPQFIMATDIVNNSNNFIKKLNENQYDCIYITDYMALCANGNMGWFNMSRLLKTQNVHVLCAVSFYNNICKKLEDAEIIYQFLK